MNTTQEDLQLAKKEAVKALLYPDCPGNVVGVGVGKKSGDDCLRIYVVSKLAPNKLSPEEMVPLSFLGVPTDVIEIGPLGRKGRKADARVDAKPQPGSPIRVQTGASNVNSGAIGTLGMVAVADKPEKWYILSCNHILAVNGRVPGSWDPKLREPNEAPNAQIVSAKFVGDESGIGEPDVYVKLFRNLDNPADCALAQIKKEDVKPTFPDGIGAVNPVPTSPEPGMEVRKVGTATGITSGTIVDVEADLYVDYSFGRFRFTKQVVIDSRNDKSEFAVRGDSGSVVWENKSKRPVAMVFAASGRYAIACPLVEVVELLQNRIREDPKYGDATLKLVSS